MKKLLALLMSAVALVACSNNESNSNQAASAVSEASAPVSTTVTEASAPVASTAVEASAPVASSAK